MNSYIYTEKQRLGITTFTSISMSHKKPLNPNVMPFLSLVFHPGYFQYESLGQHCYLQSYGRFTSGCVALLSGRRNVVWHCVWGRFFFNVIWGRIEHWKLLSIDFFWSFRWKSIESKWVVHCFCFTYIQKNIVKFIIKVQYLPFFLTTASIFGVLVCRAF